MRESCLFTITLICSGNQGHHHLIQACLQEFYEPRSHCCFISGDDQTLHKVIGHRLFGCCGQTRIGEHAGIEGDSGIEVKHLVSSRQDRAPVLTECHRYMRNQWWRCPSCCSCRCTQLP